MVTTIEPGIYFIEKLLNLAKNSENKDYINFDLIQWYIAVGGIWIEDMILITKDSYEILTNCPRTIEEIESIMKPS